MPEISSQKLQELKNNPPTHVPSPSILYKPNKSHLNPVRFYFVNEFPNKIQGAFNSPRNIREAVLANFLLGQKVPANE